MLSTLRTTMVLVLTATPFSLFGGVTDVPCVASTEVFFINGVLSDPYNSTRVLAERLRLQIAGTQLEARCINVSYALNETHRVEDILQAIDQIWLGAASNFRRTIGNLFQASPQFEAFFNQLSRTITNFNYVISKDLSNHLAKYRESAQTRLNKIVLIGHSQGNLYATQAYTRLTTEAPIIVDQNLKVLAVATPESSVAGTAPYTSRYTTLTQDFIADLIFFP